MSQVDDSLVWCHPGRESYVRARRTKFSVYAWFINNLFIGNGTPMVVENVDMVGNKYGVSTSRSEFLIQNSCEKWESKKGPTYSLGIESRLKKLFSPTHFQSFAVNFLILHVPRGQPGCSPAALSKWLIKELNNIVSCPYFLPKRRP